MLYVINFKTYKKATGRDAVRLAKICERVSKKYKKKIIVAVQAADIDKISDVVKIPVYAQHVDADKYGAHTGWIIPEAVKKDGGKGSLVNHSEHKLSNAKIKETIKRLRALKMKSIVCAKTPARAKELAKYKPDMIAIEPPGLIGGKISVSKAKPEVITRTTQAVRKIPVLCGAGIHTTEDVRRAKELGAKGVLVASGVVKARDQKKALEKLII